MTTAIEKFKEVAAFLRNTGIEDAAKEAEMLITEALHISKARLYTESIVISEDISTQINTLVLRRAKGEPIQYIIGHVDFYGIKINVDKGVLIPRPETELLVQETIKILMSYGWWVEDKENLRFKIQDSKLKTLNSKFKTLNSKLKTQNSKLKTLNSTSSVIQDSRCKVENSTLKIEDSKFKILDLCTGSGCIAIAIAKHFPDADVYGLDISDIAIEHAVKNAKENNVSNAHFIKGDLFRIAGDIPELLTQPPISPFVRGELKDSGTVISQSAHSSMFAVHFFDCIVSNPPYVKRAEIPNLQREIRDYEPIVALDGGEDGLDFYRRIFREAPMFLKENGLLILEIGINQSDDIMALASDAGVKNIRFIKDYAGIERIFIAEA